MICHCLGPQSIRRKVSVSCFVAKDPSLDSSSPVLQHGSYHESGQRASVKTPFSKVLKEHPWSRRAGVYQRWVASLALHFRSWAAVGLGTWLQATSQVACHAGHYVSLQTAELLNGF